MAYRAGKGRGHGGLDTGAVTQLRERHDQPQFSGPPALPGRDDSAQTDLLLGNGASKVPRCGKCTRPLDGEARTAQSFICTRCTGGGRGSGGGGERKEQLGGESVQEWDKPKSSSSGSHGGGIPKVSPKKAELPSQELPKRGGPLLANGAAEVVRCAKCTRPLDAEASAAEQLTCTRCVEHEVSQPAEVDDGNLGREMNGSLGRAGKAMTTAVGLGVDLATDGPRDEGLARGDPKIGLDSRREAEVGVRILGVVDLGLLAADGEESLHAQNPWYGRDWRCFAAWAWAF
eukprot:CAMPEP_0203900458 /NCGR_PEP_ID=MMETSP0359-20131031/42727_1 /ASSEMBLY_ACC=CAM_ASM_000338 /TAXON_ID=268821 /ORGANISM="Scrippsiella Hangoei, Strain SHTV-5" /LENGTH=287 /DNA_ID=CAMNT_0050823919 /DNA_START=1 /DNA_END=865 /DNA_ORIENTATION=+